MGILAWIISGLIVGLLAKFIMPSEQGGGTILTIVLGIVGAVVGGFLGTHLFGFGDVSGLDLRTMAIAVGGACSYYSCMGLLPGSAAEGHRITLSDMDMELAPAGSARS